MIDGVFNFVVCILEFYEAKIRYEMSREGIIMYNVKECHHEQGIFRYKHT